MFVLLTVCDIEVVDNTFDCRHLKEERGTKGNGRRDAVLM